MNTIIKLSIAILFLATGCQKEEYVTPQINKPTTETKWKLSMQIPALEINLNVNTSETKTLFGDHNVDIGNYLTFISDEVIVSIARLYDGTISQLTGAIKGHNFLMVDNKLNICSGAQQVDFAYQVSQ